MLWIEAPLFELEVVRLGPRRQRQKPEKELVRAGLFAVLQEGFGVIGVFNVLEPIVASGVTGNERGPVVEAEPIGIGFERERLAGVVDGGRVNPLWLRKSRSFGLDTGASPSSCWRAAESTLSTMILCWMPGKTSN